MKCTKGPGGSSVWLDVGREEKWEFSEQDWSVQAPNHRKPSACLIQELFLRRVIFKSFSVAAPGSAEMHQWNADVKGGWACRHCGPQATDNCPLKVTFPYFIMVVKWCGEVGSKGRMLLYLPPRVIYLAPLCLFKLLYKWLPVTLKLLVTISDWVLIPRQASEDW